MTATKYFCIITIFTIATAWQLFNKRICMYVYVRTYLPNVYRVLENGD